MRSVSLEAVQKLDFFRTERITDSAARITVHHANEFEQRAKLESVIGS